MTTFPGSPRILKGALVYLYLPDQTPNVVVFQYNPHTLTRSLEPQITGGEGSRRGPTRFKGAPVETINIDIEIDAADQLERGEDNAVQMGIGHHLAALETMLYPRSSDVIENLNLLNLGFIEIIPPLAPYTLFIYGSQKILPVQITSYRVSEEAHNVNLQPIRAKVSLGMRALSYDDLLPDHPGHSLFLAYQIAKETSARLGLTQSLNQVSGGDINLV
jgi:hypothetical protein